MISFKVGPVKGVEVVIGKLARIPGATAIAVITFAKYMIPFLKNYPPVKHISRAQAYPNAVVTLKSGKTVAGYFSLKQYYWVKMNIHSPYTRTNQTKDSWRARASGQQLAYIENIHPPSKYSMGSQQANMNKMVGWQKAMSVINNNLRGALSAVRRAIFAWLGF